MFLSQDDEFDGLNALQFKLGRWGWPIHGAVVVTTAAFLLSDAAPWQEIIWLSGQAVLSVAIALFCRLPAHRHSHAVYMALTGMSGLLWGIGAVVTANSGRPTDLIFLTTVIGGTALGAVAIQHPRLSALAVSLAASLPLLAVAHILVRGIHGVAMAVMVVLFGATLTLLARQMNRSIRSNMALLAERESLVAQLSHKVEQLEEATGEAVAARRAAEQANEGKSRFLAQASHDLRQPLHAIGLFVECLKDLQVSSEAESLIDRVDASLENLSSLFTSLLDISMLDVGRIKPRPSDFALQPMFAGLRDQFADAATERGIHVTFIPSTLWLREDRALLFRIVQNIVSNSVKYAPGARIVVGCRRRGGRVDIEIHDSGPGIPIEDQGRIFDEFTRAAAPNMETSPGLGLGLAIVRRLSELMGLSAELVSYPGRGTIFRLVGLQAVAPVPQARKSSATLGHDLPLRHLSILLVDDDPRVLAGTRQVLERWGCRVETAAGEAQAAQLSARMEGCDLLITDYDLTGGETGLQLAERVRAILGDTLPVIVISGVSMNELRQNPEAERVLLMSKPVRPAQLRSALMSLTLAKV